MDEPGGDRFLVDSGNPTDDTHDVLLRGSAHEQPARGVIRGRLPPTLVVGEIRYRRSTFTQRDEQGSLVHVYIPHHPTTDDRLL